MNYRGTVDSAVSARYIDKLQYLVHNAPVTALLGPRQCGKTTLAKEFGKIHESHYFDLESDMDSAVLQNPETVLSELDGLIILDEVQQMPNLFNALRVLVDRLERTCRFLILGSANPSLMKNISQSLAGRVDFPDMGGFDVSEVGIDHYSRLGPRGGYPDSYLANSEPLSIRRRNALIRTHAERDLPMLGFSIPAARIRQFWNMLAHSHRQIRNASRIARSMGVSYHTVQNYLDILTGTYIVRQLQPGHENFGKRQVKVPKVYLQDAGLLHAMLNIHDRRTRYSHPVSGASWEGLVIEQVRRELQIESVLEVKLGEAPNPSSSTCRLCRLLNLDQLFVIARTPRSFQVSDQVRFASIRDLASLCPMIRQQVTA